MRTSCIRFRPKSRLVILYEDLLEICDGSMLAAMLLAILIYWTDVKIAKKNETLWIWKSHEDFQEDLMSDKPGMKKPHRTTIKRALDLLKSKKFIYMRKNPKMPLDQTRQYLVNQKAVQDAIDALPPIVVKTTLESIKDDNASAEMRQSMSQKRQSNAEKTTSNTNDYITEITPSEITEEGEGANAPTTPAELLEDVIEIHDEVQQELKRITGEHKAVKPDNETQYHIAGGAIGNDEEEPVLTAPRLTLPSKQTPSQQAPGTGMPLLSAADPPVGRHGDAAGVQAHPLSAPTPAQAEFPPAGSDASGTTTAQASGRRRTVPERPKGGKPAVLELSLMGMDVKRWIEEARGVKIRMTENNVKACNALAETDGVSKETLAAYFAYVDQKWTVSLLEAAGLTEKESKEFLSFESNWPQLKRKLKGQPAQAPPPDWKPAENDYSPKAQLWRQEHSPARSGK